MDRIAKQSAMQSLEVYIKAMESGRGVAVDIDNGKIREMTIFDRVASALARQILGADPAAEWKSKAKELIVDKFQREARMTGMPASGDETLTNAVKSAFQPGVEISAKKLRSTILKNSGEKPLVEQALCHIFDAYDNSTSSTSRFLWKAIEKVGPDIAFARSVANNAAKWKAEIGLSTDQAFMLAYDAQRIHKKFSVSPEAAMRIRQDAGWLVKRCGLDSNNALRFAVDLHPILRDMQISIHDLAPVTESLLESKFEGNVLLSKAPAKAKLSAAVCYLQLRNEGKNHRESLQIIGKRLDRIEFIQSKLPKGCKVECIHQGAHIRATYSLDASELQEFRKVAETLSKYPLENGTQFPEVEKLKLFEHQFVRDCLRSNLNAEINSKPDPVFTPLENAKQKRTKAFTRDQLSQWADAFIGYAGSDKAAGTMSYFLSQTTFGDILKSAMRKSRNPSGEICTPGGETGSKAFFFSMNRSDAKPGMTTVTGSLLENPVYLMTGEYLPDGAEGSDNFVSFSMPLIPPAGDGKQATQSANAVRYDCVFELAKSDMETGRITCTPLSLSVSYDLVLDEAALDDMQAAAKLK
jgi:hypothetical protein